MNVLEEISRGSLRVQVLECNCGKAGCETRFLVGMIEPKPLWLSLSMVPASKVHEHLELLAEPEVLYAIAHGIALLGVTRHHLDEPEAVYAQLTAWLDIPDWMARVPVETVWEVRGRVFGQDFTRVVAALKSLDRYVPELEEGPVPAANMEMLIGRQMRLAYERKGNQ